ncbi:MULTISPECIES: restriction endonuclease subunit S [Providencia]|uniref:restriction endonuclease subunit S n=1 Tax=Providencia TaxID=586 RepID=UPI001419851F|nr:MULTISPECIES: restriction endonuclease subunit S [Providencia]NIH07207.1 restriction endonuclease subunit S [Providencia rettgeri]
MVPDGWKLSTIEEISNVSSGGTPSRKNDAYWNGNIPWVTTAEVQFKVIEDTSEKITEEGLANSSAKLFPVDTILMAMYGQGKTRGQVAKLGIEASTNQACAAIVLHPGYEVDYYYQFLVSQYENIREMANSGGQENLSGGIVKSIQVPVPPLPEQKKIAQILSTWDKAITTTEQLLTNSQQQKKALMQQLLTGKKRLMDKNGDRFSGEWKATAVAAFIKESRVPGSTGDIAKKITVKLYGNGVVAKDEKRSGSESTKYYRRSAGQFIYSKLDFLNGAFGIIPEELDGYESTLDLPAFDFLGNVNVEWFTYYVSREEFYSSNLGLANGGRKARRVNPNDLLRIKIPTPSLEEQQKIAAVLSCADQEITALQHKLEALKQEKKALMQQLLTGKRRVQLNEHNSKVITYGN